ncbi:MAG TPA: hypothetical protein VGD42_11825 [Lysobacter sp.]
MGSVEVMALVAFVSAVVLLSVVVSRQGRRRLQGALRMTFARLEFETPQGRVPGSALRVVKISRQAAGFSDDEAYRLFGDRQMPDAFWYCVGPGPSYFLAIGRANAHWRGVAVDWIVRPLSEERMRGALDGDDKAIALAFGRAIEG